MVDVVMMIGLGSLMALLLALIYGCATLERRQ
jgi:hypothetical protein